MEKQIIDLKERDDSGFNKTSLIELRDRLNDLINKGYTRYYFDGSTEYGGVIDEANLEIE